MQKVGWNVSKPVVCRLMGEGAEIAKRTLKQLNCSLLHIEDDWEAAVKLAVKLAANASRAATESRTS